MTSIRSIYIFSLWLNPKLINKYHLLALSQTCQKSLYLSFSGSKNHYFLSVYCKCLKTKVTKPKNEHYNMFKPLCCLPLISMYITQYNIGTSLVNSVPVIHVLPVLRPMISMHSLVECQCLLLHYVLVSEHFLCLQFHHRELLYFHLSNYFFNLPNLSNVLCYR